MPNGSIDFKTMSFGLFVSGGVKEGKGNKRTPTRHSEEHQSQHFQLTSCRDVAVSYTLERSWSWGGDANPGLIVRHQVCLSGSCPLTPPLPFPLPSVLQRETSRNWNKEVASFHSLLVSFAWFFFLMFGSFCLVPCDHDYKK